MTNRELHQAKTAGEAVLYEGRRCDILASPGRGGANWKLRATEHRFGCPNTPPRRDPRHGCICVGEVLWVPGVEIEAVAVPPAWVDPLPGFRCPECERGELHADTRVAVCGACEAIFDVSESGQVRVKQDPGGVS